MPDTDYTRGEWFYVLTSKPQPPISVLTESSTLDDGRVPHVKSVQETTAVFPHRVTIEWRIKEVVHYGWGEVEQLDIVSTNSSSSDA